MDSFSSRWIGLSDVVSRRAKGASLVLFDKADRSALVVLGASLADLPTRFQ